VPEVIDYLLDLYLRERDKGEKFRAFITRIGRKRIKEELKPFTEVPPHEVDSSFYADWADARKFTIGDIGVGECAGEVVTLTDFGIAAAEGLHFDAQVVLEESKEQPHVDRAADLAYQAMLSAAQALIKVQNIDIADEPDTIVREFRQRFHDTRLFFDPYAKGKFAHYLFSAHENRNGSVRLDTALQLIEEAGLFIEAAHACNTRLLEGRANGGNLAAQAVRA
jgi:sulfite reductase (ferredoxin)